MPDPTQPPAPQGETRPERPCDQAPCRESERLIAAIERLTRAVEGLRQALVIEESPQGDPAKRRSETIVSLARGIAARDGHVMASTLAEIVCDLGPEMSDVTAYEVADTLRSARFVVLAGGRWVSP